MWDREIVCSDRGMMRGTAVGATWDAVEEFNAALFSWVSFQGAPIIAQISRFFPYRIINLYTEYNTASSLHRLRKLHQ